MTDTAVRRVRPDDGPQWRALRLHALADTPIAFIETVEQAQARPEVTWRQLVAAHSVGCAGALFVAERDGIWVGMAGGCVEVEGTTTIFTVFVNPDVRGQRILEALFEAVSEWSASCARATLALEVAVENPRAHAAYRRLGFTETGRTRVHPLYPDIIEVELSRPATLHTQTFPGAPSTRSRPD